MVKYIKEGMGVEEQELISDDVEQKVKALLKDVKERGDAAVRELSEKFDHYTPESFRLSQKEIDEAMKQVSDEELNAIKFSLEQVRTFAEAQRGAIQDLEVETHPGVFLGHKNIPINAVGCYVPGGRYPMIASAIMSIATAKAAGVAACGGVYAAQGRQALPRHRRHNDLGGRRRNLRLGRRSGDGGDGLGDGLD